MSVQFLYFETASGFLWNVIMQIYELFNIVSNKLYQEFVMFQF